MFGNSNVISSQGLIEADFKSEIRIILLCRAARREFFSLLDGRLRRLKSVGKDIRSALKTKYQGWRLST